MATYEIGDTDVLAIQVALLAHQDYIGTSTYDRFTAQVRVPKAAERHTCCFNGLPCGLGCVSPSGVLCGSAKPLGEVK